MSSAHPKRTQQLEGPWRKLTPDRANSAREIHERYLGKTGEDNLNMYYGEGNWTFDTSRFDVENQLEGEMTRAANNIAREGLRNVIGSNITQDYKGEPRQPQGDTYVDDDGNRLTGRIETRTAAPALGDTLISPDGDRFYKEYTDSNHKSKN